MQRQKGSNWQALLNRWLNGRITAREEQELDRLAQEDPFLAEALDGYRQHPESDHGQKVATLRAHLQQRQNRRGFLVWRIAAAIAFLVVAGVAMWQVNNTGSQDLAQMEQMIEEVPEPMEEVPDQPASYEDGAMEEVIVLDDQADSEIEAVVPALSRSTLTIPPPLVIVDATPVTIQPVEPPPSVAPAEAVVADAIQPKQVVADQGVGEEEERTKAIKDDIQEEALMERAPSFRQVPPFQDQTKLYYALTEISDTKRRRTKEVSGVIQTSEGEPVPGATISIPGASKSTLTELDGQFSLKIPAEAKHLEVVYLNDAQRFRIGGRDSFFLDTEQMLLDEVVITGYGKKKSRNAGRARTRVPTTAYSPEPYTIPVSPRPSVDTMAYRQYMQDSLRFPEAARQAAISGTVTVQFSIDRAGRLFDFLMIKSLGYGCDEEAIRLLKDGPAWIGAENSITTYTIRFDE